MKQLLAVKSYKTFWEGGILMERATLYCNQYATRNWSQPDDKTFPSLLIKGLARRLAEKAPA